MNTIEAIRNEIKRLEEIHERNLKKPMERGRIGFAHGVVECCDKILSFIDSLPDEPAPKGYDEAYLNECIAKASKTWEGVDVDKYMDEVRGNRPKSSDNLEKEFEKYLSENIEFDRAGSAMDKWNRGCHLNRNDLEDIARHFADWQKEQIMDEWLKDRDGCFLDGVNEGKKAMEEQMMKEAVEGLICATITGTDAISFLSPLPKELKAGDKVHIIIVKEDEQ